MSTSIGNQIDGLRQLARILNPGSLKRCGVIRESEAKHLLDTLKDAAETLDEADKREAIDEPTDFEKLHLALQITSGMLASVSTRLKDGDSEKIKFTGEFAHLGTMTISAALDLANEALET